MQHKKGKRKTESDSSWSAWSRCCGIRPLTWTWTTRVIFPSSLYSLTLTVSPASVVDEPAVIQSWLHSSLLQVQTELVCRRNWIFSVEERVQIFFNPFHFIPNSPLPLRWGCQRCRRRSPPRRRSLDPTGDPPGRSSWQSCSPCSRNSLSLNRILSLSTCSPWNHRSSTW